MSEVIFNTYPTPLEYYDEFRGNKIYIKRDDLTEPALGGNKVRKLELFLADAQKENADYIVTYGAAQSNHCRLTVATAHKLGFKTLLILAKSDEVNYNGNYLIYDLFDTEIVWTDINHVSETIETTLKGLTDKGFNPYFIQGGGHGNLGTHAYKLAFDEIQLQQQQMNIDFDYIFHASGTGTTQAGLVAGKTIEKSKIDIVGISIARNEKRGKEVIKKSVTDYLEENYTGNNTFKSKIIFTDRFVGKGYADIYPGIISTIRNVAKSASILLDPVYTGKAFHGMLKYIEENEVKDRHILFLHTGGTPLLFNYASNFKEE